MPYLNEPYSKSDLTRVGSIFLNPTQNITEKIENNVLLIFCKAVLKSLGNGY